MPEERNKTMRRSTKQAAENTERIIRTEFKKMESILQTIAENTKERVAASKREVPLAVVRKHAEERYRAERYQAERQNTDVAGGAQKIGIAREAGGAQEAGGTQKASGAQKAGNTPALPFEAALSAPGMRFICECKKASPSKGIIAERFPYLDIAADYEEAGAACLSVLTEPKWFLGDLSYLEKVAAAVSIPCLRKDFTVDPYMIYEAKAAGASAVLLIASLLTDEEIREDLAICRDIGLSALCEAHDAKEVERLAAAGAWIIGVNNRNLADFSVDFSNSLALRQYAPEGTLFVAESGVKTAEDVKLLYDNGIRACLIGETLMRSDDKKAKLTELQSLL